MTEALYKITGPKGEAVHGGFGSWKLPRDKRAGAWMPEIHDVQCCSRGYHLLTVAGFSEWLKTAAVVWEAEGRGATDSQGTKTAFAEARLLRKVGVLDKPTCVLLAADFAERVLPIFEAKYPADDRPCKAIEAARAWAENPTAGAAANAYAAYAAAYAAGAAANAYAAYAAVYAANAAANAAYAAAYAANAAAYANAYAADAADAGVNAANAAYAAANAEREWQGGRILEVLLERSERGHATWSCSLKVKCHNPITQITTVAPPARASSSPSAGPRCCASGPPAGSGPRFAETLASRWRWGSATSRWPWPRYQPRRSRSTGACSAPSSTRRWRLH